jgi:hypothetical protein
MALTEETGSTSHYNQAHYLAELHNLWSLGDWQSLSELSANEQKEACTEQKIYLASSLYQLGRFSEANELIRQLKLTLEQKKIAAKVLISGVYNSLSRAHACANNYVQAEILCKRSLTETSNRQLTKAQLNARISEQFSQLGIPRLADNITPREFKPDAEVHLNALSSYFSHEPFIQVALAELYQFRGQYEHAIVRWQNASSLLNAEMPQVYYDRLKDAYKAVQGFPQGTTEQESLRGDIDKHRLLSEIHKHLQPEFYFEIGVQTGKSLALAKCEAIGVDPMPMVVVELPASSKVITSSSDSFFKKQSDILLQKSIDLCFIDGMHLFEYVLRDFINVEKYAKPNSLIIIDDIFPGHPDQAKRERCTRAWTGDVWKLKETLAKYRPDLFILAIDAYPTGLLLISALDPSNTTLSDSYQIIKNDYSNLDPAPEKLINREGSISGSSEIIHKVLDALKSTKHQDINASTLKLTLENFVNQ